MALTTRTQNTSTTHDPGTANIIRRFGHVQHLNPKEKINSLTTHISFLPLLIPRRQGSPYTRLPGIIQQNLLCSLVDPVHSSIIAPPAALSPERRSSLKPRPLPSKPITALATMKFVLIADKVGSRISYRIVIPRSEVRCLLEAVDHYSRAVTPRSKRKETCSYAELIIIERGVGVLNRHFSKYGLWCTAEKYPIEWLRRAPTPVSWGSEIDESLANTQGWIDASDKSEEVLMVCCNPHWRGDFHGRKATKLVAQLRKIEAAVEAVNRSSYFWLSVAWLAQNLTRRPRKGRARPTKKTRPAKMVRTILDFM